MAKLASTTIYGSLTITDPSTITIGNTTKNLDCITDLNFTVSDIGAVSKLGDTVTGTLYSTTNYILKSTLSNCSIYSDSSDFGLTRADNAWVLRYNKDSGVLNFSHTPNVEGHNIYHAGNKPTYIDVGAVSTTNYDKEWSITLDLAAATWTSTGIRNIDTGTYLLYLLASNNGVDGHYSETYAGVMTWYAGGTNSTVVTEIPLTSSGHATGSKFMAAGFKRVGGNTGQQELVIACSHAAVGCTYLIRVKRIG